MASIGKVSAVFTASTSGLTAGVKSAQSSFRGLQSSTKGLESSMRALVAINATQLFASVASSALSGVRSLVSFGQAQADIVDNASKLAARLGMTYGEFAGLSLAADLAGVSMETVGAASQKAEIAFAKAAGGSKTAIAAFDTLGLSVDQLNGMSAADRFDAIASSIAALPTEAQRAAAAVQIFGKSGSQLLPLFAGGAEGIAAARAEAERLGLTLTNAQGQNVEAMNDSFTMVGKTIQGVVQQVTAFLAPAITAIANQFTKFVGDVGGATIGQRIGEGILEGAKFIAAVGDAVIAGFASVFDYLSQVGGQWSSVWAIGARVGAILEGGFRTGQLILNAIGGFLSDVVSSLFSAAAQLAEIVPGFGKYADTLKASSEQWATTADGFAASADASLAAAGQAFATAIDGPLAQSGQAIAGPLTAGLRSAIAQAQQAASAVDTASKKPVDVKQTVTVDVKEAIKGIDSRTSEGIAEMYRIIRGDTGNVQEQQLAALEEIAANTSDFEPIPAVAID